MQQHAIEKHLCLCTVPISLTTFKHVTAVDVPSVSWQLLVVLQLHLYICHPWSCPDLLHFETTQPLSGDTHGACACCLAPIRFRNRVLDQLAAGTYHPVLDDGVTSCLAQLTWWLPDSSSSAAQRGNPVSSGTQQRLRRRRRAHRRHARLHRHVLRHMQPVQQQPLLPGSIKV